MKKQSLIHIKLDPDELIQSKKNTLSAEANLIRILQIIKKYHNLRIKELKLKAKLLRKLKETRLGITKLEQTLPSPEIPEILKEKTKEPEQEKSKTTTKKDNLESQLEEIQRKLREMEG